jgi:hypothetical protein
MKNLSVKFLVLPFLGFLAVTSLQGFPGKSPSQDINDLYHRIFDRMTPTERDKISVAVKNYEQKISSADRNFNYYSMAEREIKHVLPNRPSSIIMDEFVFIAIVEATKDMDDDIRQIMQEIKAMTAAKQKLRETIKELNKWISQEMNNLSDPDEIDLDKVSSGGKDEQKRVGLDRTKIFPKMEVTTNFKVKFYKTPTIDSVTISSRMSLNELKRRREYSNEELKILLEAEEATQEALRPLNEKRNKLRQLIEHLKKKMKNR